MKLSLMVFIALFSHLLWAEPRPVKADPVKTIVSYLQEQPASVGGTITVDEQIELYNEKRYLVPFRMYVKKNQPIHFYFDETQLEIYGDQVVVLSGGGIPIKIKKATFNLNTGKFHVDSDYFLGVGEKKVNEEVEKYLEKNYKPKLIAAAAELQTLRKKNELQDMNAVLKGIARIFTNENGKPLPTVRGNVTLNFTPKQKRDLKIDTWTAEVQPGDSIGFTMGFVRTGTTFTVDTTEVRSFKGIRIHGDTKFPEIVSVNFRMARFDQSGAIFDYDIGAEEVLTGLRLLLGVITSYSGTDPRRLIYECDPVRIEAIRKSIDGSLKKEISLMISKNRERLITAGASPALLAALE